MGGASSEAPPLAPRPIRSDQSRRVYRIDSVTWPRTCEGRRGEEEEGKEGEGRGERVTGGQRGRGSPGPPAN